MKKELLSAAVAQSYDAFVAIDKNGTIVEWNASAAGLFGWSREEAVGQSITETIIPEINLPETIQRTAQSISEFLETGITGVMNKQIEVIARTKTGDMVPVFLAIFNLSMEQEVLFGAFVQDARVRKRLEEQLIETKNMLQLVMNNIPQSIFWKDKDLRYLGCNKAFAEDAGLNDPEEIVGLTDFELPWKKEETEIFREYDRLVMETGKPEFHIVEPCSQADGFQAWLDTNKIPLRNIQGEIIGVLGTYEDITERVTLLQQREDYMSALAHDLKVPIVGAIRALDVLLSQQFGSLSDVQLELVSKLLDSHKDMLIMIKNLLQVLRYETSAEDFRLSEIDMSRLVSTTIEEMKQHATLRNVELSHHIEPGVSARIDSMAIKRLLQNLIGNGLKYTQPGGTVTIVMKQIKSSIVIEVSDNGEGIAEEDKHRLFQRFGPTSRLKRANAGSGLGLYLCKKIVDGHHGTISCRSEVGQGTTFTVELIKDPSSLKSHHMRRANDLISF